MANQLQDFPAGLDELGLESPFAEALQAEDHFVTEFTLNEFGESPFAEHFQEESSAWLGSASKELGSEAEGFESPLSEAEGFDPEYTEASWSESPSDEGYEGDELEAFEPFEASQAWEGTSYDREEPQHELSSLSGQQFVDAGQTFGGYAMPSEASKPWDTEDLAWLDVEAQATDGAGYEPTLSEADEFEPEFSNGYETTESPYLPEAEALAGDVAALEHLIESEAGAGTGLADRLKGAAAFLLGPTLREESSGPAVAALQRALERYGADLAVDGSFGANTEHAVRTFQSRSGLTVDGVVGPRTKGAIAGTLGGDRKQRRERTSLPICEAIVQIAEEEYRRWHPATGNLRETDSAAVPILQQYYREALHRHVSAAELQDTVWQRQHPWSAVFISWVMRRAGAGSKFTYSGAHQNYIRAARLNRINSENTSPFWAYRATEVVLQVGDLICASRSNSGATYDNIADPQVRATHCDIVTVVRPGSLRVIGGNVRQSVDAKTVRTLPDGRLALDGDQARIFAVVRCQRYVTEMSSQRQLSVDYEGPELAGRLCSGVSTAFPDNWRKTKVRPEGADPDGQVVDRTTDPAYRPPNTVFLARELTHYDVNDWEIQFKKNHRNEVADMSQKICVYLQADPARSVQVSITGGADIPGGAGYNQLLSCKRANLAQERIEDYIRTAYPQAFLDPKRITFDTSGKGFADAKCKGKRCYDPDYRSVLIVVHPSRTRVLPIPPLPDRNTCEFKIRCCSFKTSSILQWDLDKFFESTLPPGLQSYLKQYPSIKSVYDFLCSTILNVIKLTLKDIAKFRFFDKLVKGILKYCYVELIHVEALIEVVEGGTTSPRSLLLDYTGIGFRVKKPSIPLPSSITSYIDKLPPSIKNVVKEKLKAFLAIEIGTEDLSSTCAGDYVDFRLVTVHGSNNDPKCEPRPIYFFQGMAEMGTAGQFFAGLPGFTKGVIGIGWPNSKFPIQGVRISCLPYADKCGRTTIWLPLGSAKGTEIFIASAGSLSQSKRTCDPCAPRGISRPAQKRIHSLR